MADLTFNDPDQAWRKFWAYTDLTGDGIKDIVFINRAEASYELHEAVMDEPPFKLTRGFPKRGVPPRRCVMPPRQTKTW